ncbi:MAG: carbamoyltransferase N-terminal domain-containing protein, partial [Nitrospiria bacterium]
MKIMGISGLESSAAFKKAQWPNLDEREERICQGYDAAAALIIDGEIVAATAEERMNRRKHSAAFPLGAIRSCLNQAGLAIGDVDEIAHAFDYEPWAAAYALDAVAA